MSDIEQLLRDTIGLDAASIGSSSIQRTIRLRMKSLGLKSADQYRDLLRQSPTEMTELVEAVVVTETWFFRDQQPFAALVELLTQEWLSRNTGGQARLLSLPCSSGEEAYSMAMALLDAGMAPERFRIEGIDLSGRALAKSRQGLYTRNSFRGKNLAYRDRWFQPLKDGYLLAQAVRQCVSFSQANLLSPEFPVGGAQYDFIFCRNLLIYFDRFTQARALEKLRRLLPPSGVLFVGAAEQPLVLEHGFVSANLPLAFACRRNDAPAAVPRAARPARALRLPAHARVEGAGQAGRNAAPADPRAAPPGSASAPRAPSAPTLQPEPDSSEARAHLLKFPPTASAELERARHLADAGQLAEAAAACEAYLKHSRASASGWYLLGLVREASGDPAAIDCYRKALYLEPNHYESLLQMASLAEKNGDNARARTYKRRAQRRQSNPR